MSITVHPLFERLAPYIKIEMYARDGGHQKPRRRIELNSQLMDKDLLQAALAVTVACCACGQAISPFRPRQKGSGERAGPPRHVYVAVACDLATNLGCSRGTAARDEYIRIENRRKQLAEDAR